MSLARHISPSKGELLLGFRKTGTNQGIYELAVNARNRSNLPVQTPAPQIVSIARSGNTSMAFFTTTDETFTCTLYCTNSAGLTSSNWPASTKTLARSGNTGSLSDTTKDANRSCRVGGQ